jgi:putative sigma-54 modulation protein
MSRKSKAAEFVQDIYNISVTGRNVLVTDAMKDYAIEKISKIERFSPRIIDVVVTMDVQKLEHRVDILIKVGQIKIKSQASSDNMYASLDKAVHKIESQLRRYKQKIQDHQSKPWEFINMKVNVVRPPSPETELMEINDDIESENLKEIDERYRPLEIVKEETIPVKLLTWDEAVMKMDLSGDKFLIFKNEADLKLNVIYKREDGNYGIIETTDSK